MIKIALPANQGMVEGHFGQCESYAVITIGSDNKIQGIETLQSPEGCGCKSNIAGVLQSMGVSVMLAGNMGEGALQVLSRHGIKVYRGCSGPVEDVVESFLTGSVIDSGIGCSQHEQHHSDHPHDGHHSGSCNHR